MPDASQFTAFAKGRASSNISASLRNSGPKPNSIIAAVQYSVVRRGAQIQKNPTIYVLTPADLANGSNRSLIILNSAGLIIQNTTGSTVYMSYADESGNGTIESLTSPGFVTAGTSFTDRNLFSRGITSLPAGKLLLKTTNEFTATVGPVTYTWRVGSIIVYNVQIDNPTQTTIQFADGITEIHSTFFDVAVLRNVTTIIMPSSTTFLPVFANFPRSTLTIVLPPVALDNIRRTNPTALDSISYRTTTGIQGPLPPSTDPNVITLTDLAREQYLYYDSRYNTYYTNFNLNEITIDAGKTLMIRPGERFELGIRINSNDLTPTNFNIRGTLLITEGPVAGIGFTSGHLRMYPGSGLYNYSGNITNNGSIDTFGTVYTNVTIGPNSVRTLNSSQGNGQILPLP